MALSQSVWSLVASLVNQRPFRADFVAKATKTELQRIPAESNDYFSVLRGDVPNSQLLMRVELRLPTPQGIAKDGIILLELQPASCVSKDDAMSQFGNKPELSFPTPQQPSDALLYLVYRFDWGVLRLGFDRKGPECLKTLVLDATQVGTAVTPR
jgi:hypothetical protein